MLKKYSGIDVPKRSHIDEILRKYIWIDSRNKKYIKEKNQFKEVTKYKGNYIVKKQKAGSLLKGGFGLINTCNNDKDTTFLYKTQFYTKDTGKEKDLSTAYLVYFKEGITTTNFGDSDKFSNRCTTIDNEKKTIKKLIEDILVSHVTATEIFHIYKENKANYYKMVTLNHVKTKTMVEKYYKDKKTLIINIDNKNFYICFEPISINNVINDPVTPDNRAETIRDADVKELRTMIDNLIIKEAQDNELERRLMNRQND
jgi:hypothetical protein